MGKIRTSKQCALACCLDCCFNSSLIVFIKVQTPDANHNVFYVNTLLWQPGGGALIIFNECVPLSTAGFHRFIWPRKGTFCFLFLKESHIFFCFMFLNVFIFIILVAGRLIIPASAKNIHVFFIWSNSFVGDNTPVLNICCLLFSQNVIETIVTMLDC